MSLQLASQVDRHFISSIQISKSLARITSLLLGTGRLQTAGFETAPGPAETATAAPCRGWAGMRSREALRRKGRWAISLNSACAAKQKGWEYNY